MKNEYSSFDSNCNKLQGIFEINQQIVNQTKKIENYGYHNLSLQKMLASEGPGNKNCQKKYIDYNESFTLQNEQKILNALEENKNRINSAENIPDERLKVK